MLILVMESNLAVQVILGTYYVQDLEQVLGGMQTNGTKPIF